MGGRVVTGSGVNRLATGRHPQPPPIVTVRPSLPRHVVTADVFIRGQVRGVSGRDVREAIHSSPSVTLGYAGTSFFPQLQTWIWLGCSVFFALSSSNWNKIFWISRKPLEIEAWFQRTTNRKWHMGYYMVTWPMTSRDRERSNSWPQYA